MWRAPASDFWSVGLACTPQSAWLDSGRQIAHTAPVHWMPSAGDWLYRADPFGLQRGEHTHVFVERFDYRTKHGEIEHLSWSPGQGWSEANVVLSRDWHLSYPFVFEHAGATWMVPESHQTQELALYRATGFPLVWVKEAILLRDLPVAEASLLQHQGRWWLFYTLVGKGGRDQRELHLAHAPDLFGPWTPLSTNPVLVDQAGARPGGRPFVDAQGQVVLPVQDCHVTYGGGLRFLCFTQLEPDQVVCRHLPTRWQGSDWSAQFPDGLHTLSAVGEWTLFDCKRIERSHARRWLDWQRRWRRWMR